MNRSKRGSAAETMIASLEMSRVNQGRSLHHRRAQGEVKSVGITIVYGIIGRPNGKSVRELRKCAQWRSVVAEFGEIAAG